MDCKVLYKLFRQHPVVTTDSRKCPEGSMFFALKGEHFDGNQYAAKALEAGCGLAVVDDARVIPEGDSRYIHVANVLEALQELAREHRRHFTHPVIQVTGTNGKTTTKELLHAVLSKKYKVLATEGNLNNHIGVPLTLLRLTDEHTLAVIETGANHPGEIQTLSNIVEPDYGLITNVGKAHLEGFGSFEGVKRTKGELYDYLRRKEGGKVFLNDANPHLCQMAEGLTTIRYGKCGKQGLLVEGELNGKDAYMAMTWRAAGKDAPWNEVKTHLIGGYNLDNALAAACVGTWFGVSGEQISEALAEYQPRLGRSELRQTEHNRLIVDAYNANPTSMRLSLENFSRIESGHKMVILGDMRELGSESMAEHQYIADMLPTMGIEEAWLVGSQFGATHNEAKVFADVEEVKAELRKRKPEGMLILLKGSNGTKLYELPEML